jgi:lycopene cyclase domain-containing protein
LLRSAILAGGLAVVLNAVAALGGFSYQASVVLVFGGMVAFFAANARKVLAPNDWKLFAGFFLAGNVATTVLEVFMMRFDVWGFTCRTQHLTGWTLLGAPVEEYEYWACCVAMVPLSYLAFSRRQPSMRVDPAFLTKLEAFASQLHLKAKTDPVSYVEETEGEVGQFARGARFPVYICIQLVFVAAIAALVRRYHGNWKALVATVVVFSLAVFPNEFYSIHRGYWAYNSQKMVGIYFLRIPLEGWLMYFLPACFACMVLDIADRDIFGRDV